MYKDGEIIIRAVVDDLLGGRATRDEAVERLLERLGRSGREFYFDDTTNRWLDPHIACMHFLVGGGFSAGTPAMRIKESLWGKVLVTERGEEFSDPDDMRRYYYGVLWLVSKGDEAERVRRVKDALIRWDLAFELTQAARV